MKIIGMVHLPPLPGSPGYNESKTRDYVDYALSEVSKLYNACFNGVIIENYMDYPYSVRLMNSEAIEILREVMYSVKREYRELLIGLNILRNSCVEAVNIACKTGIDFIRVNAYLEPVIAPEGFLKPMARSIWSKMSEHKCSVKIYADVNVKHSKPLIDYAEALYNTYKRGRVSGIIITGLATGLETPVYKILVARKICSGLEIWVGSGVSIRNIGKYISLADGVIVGTSIKINSITENPVDPGRAKEFVEKTRRFEKIVEKQIDFTKSVGGSINSLLK